MLRPTERFARIDEESENGGLEGEGRSCGQTARDTNHADYSSDSSNKSLDELIEGLKLCDYSSGTYTT